MSRLVQDSLTWLDRRTAIPTLIQDFLHENIPASAGWPQVFGSIALFLFLTQALTGVLLALNYAATAGEAYQSLQYIIHLVVAGRLVRGLHHWGASWMIVAVCVHMAQVFIYGAYKKPRETTWIAGVFLLLLTLGFGLTGYLLPWDNRAYWGSMVTTQIIAGIPVAGSVLSDLLGSRNGLGAITFSRFYALHTLVLPGVTTLLILLHVYLVRLHGIAPRPSNLPDEKAFYPQQLFRDFAAVFIIFVTLFLAAAFIDAPLERMANPRDTTFVPRPEWYFLFLFQLVKVFPGRLEWLGTVVLPGLSVVLLVLLPFLKSLQRMVLSGRLQAIGVTILVFAIWSGLTAAAMNGAHQHAAIGEAAGMELGEISPAVIAGYGLFRSSGCESCHALGAGTPRSGPLLGVASVEHAPDWLNRHFEEFAVDAQHERADAELNNLLAFTRAINVKTAADLRNMSTNLVSGAAIYVSRSCYSCHKVNEEGGNAGPAMNGLASRRDEEWIREHFINPSKLSPGTIMPPFRFSKQEERDLIQYLLSLP
jgi:ubiquinol-cytochrome c reductase cytochrome b subunit